MLISTSLISLGRALGDTDRVVFWEDGQPLNIVSLHFSSGKKIEGMGIIHFLMTLRDIFLLGSVSTCSGGVFMG